jgi:hypothetical protein
MNSLLTDDEKSIFYQVLEQYSLNHSVSFNQFNHSSDNIVRR